MGRLSKPQRVENEKLLELVRKFQATQDSDSFEKIAKTLEGYFSTITRKFFISGNNSDDIYQEALFALATKAIPDYDEKKGSFIAFAKLCIRRHIITVLKASKNKKQLILNTSPSIDKAMTTDEDGPTPLGELAKTDEASVMDEMIRSEAFYRLKALLKGKLTGLEADILDLYLKNMSYVDIVKIMNKKRRGKRRVDCKTIDNALCRIKKKAVELELEIDDYE